MCIVVRQVEVTDTTTFITYWIWIQIIINWIFFLELISDFIVHGFFKSYSKLFRMWPETICQILNFIA